MTGTKSASRYSLGMENANKIREKLNKRAMQLYISDHPEAKWAVTPADEEILRKSKEESKGSSSFFGNRAQQSPVADDQAQHSDDLIELQIQA